MDGVFKGDCGIKQSYYTVCQWIGDPMAIIRQAIQSARAILSPSEYTKPVVEQLRTLEGNYVIRRKRCTGCPNTVPGDRKP
jgi:hypothetical protein